MNCFSASSDRLRRQVFTLLACFLCCVACSEASPDSAGDSLSYSLEYTLEVLPSSGEVQVRLDLEQDRHLLREMRMSFNMDRVTDIDGDGEINLDDGAMVWKPPKGGGSIEWRVQVSHRRNGNGHDAWLAPAWGMFRAEDVIPRASTRTLKAAVSETTLVVDLPKGWSAVTEYFGRENRFEVDRDQRRFDQPAGWIVVGKLGVRRDEIANTRIAVAAPVGESVRRLEMLALLRWTLPELARVLPSLPSRLTVVSAGDPMWRGALSAPGSLFIHAERPLISENATSTLLHEVVHVATRLDAAPGYDWIVEGIAEYYSLELLYRSGSISRNRYKAARDSQAEWAQEAEQLCADSASGPVTALAVTLFARLDAELKSSSDGEVTLDELTAKLVETDRQLDAGVLASLAEELTGGNIETLHTDNLPGCRNITPIE